MRDPAKIREARRRWYGRHRERIVAKTLAIYHRRKAASLCRVQGCKTPPCEDHGACPRHRLGFVAARQKAMKALRRRRLAAHLCIRCGKPAAFERRECARHMAIGRLQATDRRKRKTAKRPHCGCGLRLRLGQRICGSCVSADDAATRGWGAWT